jgi:hypothetical protein
MHYKLKNDKQMLHLARLSFLIVTSPLDSFSLGTRANYLHIKVRLDIVIDCLTKLMCLFSVSSSDAL